MGVDEELKQRLADEVQGAVRPAASGLEHVVERGRSLRRRRLGLFSGMGIAVVALITVASPSLMSPLTPGDGRSADLSVAGRSASAGGTAETGSVAQVASFSVRAAANADLLQAYGRLWDYRSTEPAETGWYVYFAPMECTRTVQVETCNRIAQRDARLHVDQEADRFVVLDADGPMTPQQRADLIAYTEEANSEPDQWEYPVVALRAAVVDHGVTDIKAVGLWTGPIPSVKTSACILRVFNPAGELVAEERLPARGAPRWEEERAGGFIITSISSELNAKSAAIKCT